MHIGDKLKAVSTCSANSDKGLVNTLVPGKLYTVEAVFGNSFSITNELGESHNFSKDTYQNYFEKVESFDIKEGDVLYAKDPCYMGDGVTRPSLVVGKGYEIVEDHGSQIMIIDEDGSNHWFDFNDLSEFFTLNKKKAEGNAREFYGVDNLIKKYETLIEITEEREAFAGSSGDVGEEEIAYELVKAYELIVEDLKKLKEKIDAK